ncbi:MAG: sugar ABC transporter permease [Spirochaetaceae bacterium]|jgi:N-acetylglucosamine transport system permease protein|nr:sugar ABC transporter permease [Spirochaetaceae bacterium]
MRGIRRALFIFIMTVPVFIGYCYFGILPYIKGFYYSFFKWSGYTQVMRFVGLENFKRLVGDKNLFNALSNNTVIFLISTVVTFVLALFFAVVITRSRFKETLLYRITYFFPYVMPTVAIAILWRFIFNPSVGILNGLLTVLKLDSLTHAWLGEKATVLGAVTAPIIWGSLGFFMVLFISGIQSIPVTLYEAAQIDGAGEFQQFIRITFPLLWEIMRTMIVFFISGSIGCFALVRVMAGLTNPAAEVLGTYMYKHAFQYIDFGYGTAIGVFIFVLALVLALVMRRLTKKELIEF